VGYSKGTDNKPFAGVYVPFPGDGTLAGGVRCQAPLVLTFAGTAAPPPSRSLQRWIAYRSAVLRHRLRDEVDTKGLGA